MQVRTHAPPLRGLKRQGKVKGVEIVSVRTHAPPLRGLKREVYVRHGPVVGQSEPMPRL